MLPLIFSAMPESWAETGTSNRTQPEMLSHR
jgi:hypothetical protein